ncbi:MAG: LysM peptidoglycan-binding domain-containing protein [Zetaproteobacteria bacterium]|nr:LysM peptidoglycan-binding domain-containing protein [Zetaproteobacteria bacterium]
MLNHRPRSMLAVWLALMIIPFSLFSGGCATSSEEESEGLALEATDSPPSEGDSEGNFSTTDGEENEGQFDGQEFIDQEDFAQGGDLNLGQNQLNTEDTFQNNSLDNDPSEFSQNPLENEGNLLDNQPLEDGSGLAGFAEQTTEEVATETATTGLESNEDSPTQDGVSYGQGGVVTGHAALPAREGLPELGSKLVYVVVSGDTLGRISRKIYGSSGMWQKLADLSGIQNPNLIFPGDLVYYQLTEASLAFAAEYEGLAKTEVAVTEPTSLQNIAVQVYGSRSNWKHIWRQNGHINSPHQLKKGTVVTVVTAQALESIEDKFIRRGIQSKAEKSTNNPFKLLSKITEDKKLESNWGRLEGQTFHLGSQTSGLLPKG